LVESFNCRTLRKEDEESVKLLVKSASHPFSVEKFWNWKYLQNPGFDRSLIAVAESNGKIIGCNHWLRRKLKLSDSIVVDSMMGANIAVAPEFRKKGIGKALICFLRSQHEKRKPLLMCMYTDFELSKHFHTPVGGYVPAPNGTVKYMRILNWNRVKAHADAFNERVKHGEFKGQLANVDVAVAFKMPEAPSLCLRLHREGVNICASVEGADVTISSDLRTLARIRERNGGFRTLIMPLLKGKVKLEGSFRKLLDLYKNRWVLWEILGKEII